MLILPIGLLTMAAGFLIRIARHVDEGQSVGIYTAETLFILLSVRRRPAFHLTLHAKS